MLVYSDFFHDIHEFVERIGSVHSKILVLKYHEIATLASSLFLPFSSEFKLGLAIIAIQKVPPLASLSTILPDFVFTLKSG